MNELKKRVWSPGEKAAWLADKIVTGAPDYCNEAAGLLRKYSDIEKENEAMKRYLAGEKPSYSTGICGSLTCGYGNLDDLGYFEFQLDPAVLTMGIKLPAEPTKEILNIIHEFVGLSYNPANKEEMFREKHMYNALLNHLKGP